MAVYDSCSATLITLDSGPCWTNNMKLFHRRLSKLWHCERAIVKVAAELGKDACVLPMSYETVQRWPLKAYSAICAFLGVRANRSLISATQTLPTPRNMCESVTNWDQLCASFFVCGLWPSMIPRFRDELFLWKNFLRFRKLKLE